MSQYQTGELAKLKNVSVRTIQYYDRKGLLKTVQTAKMGGVYLMNKANKI